MEILYNVLTVSGGLSGVAGLIMCWVVYRQFAAERRAREEEADQRKKLAGKLETLELEKFARLEKQVTDHLRADKSLELLTEMRHVNGNLEKLTAQVARALETNAGQASDIANNQACINNLRQDLQEHIRFCNGRCNHGK